MESSPSSPSSPSSSPSITAQHLHHLHTSYADSKSRFAAAMHSHAEFSQLLSTSLTNMHDETPTTTTPHEAHHHQRHLAITSAAPHGHQDPDAEANAETEAEAAEADGDGDSGVVQEQHLEIAKWYLREQERILDLAEHEVAEMEWVGGEIECAELTQVERRHHHHHHCLLMEWEHEMVCLGTLEGASSLWDAHDDDNDDGGM